MYDKGSRQHKYRRLHPLIRWYGPREYQAPGIHNPDLKRQITPGKIAIFVHYLCLFEADHVARSRAIFGRSAMGRWFRFRLQVDLYH